MTSPPDARRRPEANRTAEGVSQTTPSVSPEPWFWKLLNDAHAAWVTGYDVGLAHGRAAERGLVHQEQRSARAGAVAARIASLPPINEAQQARERAGRRRTAERIASGVVYERQSAS